MALEYETMAQLRVALDSEEIRARMLEKAGEVPDVVLVPNNAAARSRILDEVVNFGRIHVKHGPLDSSGWAPIAAPWPPIMCWYVRDRPEECACGVMTWAGRQQFGPPRCIPCYDGRPLQHPMSARQQPNRHDRKRQGLPRPPGPPACPTCGWRDVDGDEPCGCTRP